MKGFSRFCSLVALAATLVLGACGDGAETDTDTNALDTARVDDTMNYTPADSGLPTNADSNSTAGPDSTGKGDVGADGDTSDATSDAGSSSGNRDLAALVESQLMVMHSGVDVDVQGDGVVILKGSVASQQEKTAAEAEAKRIVGVKQVRNEIAVR